MEQPLTLYDIRGMAGPYRVALRDKPQEVLIPLSAPLARRNPLLASRPLRPQLEPHPAPELGVRSNRPAILLIAIQSSPAAAGLDPTPGGLRMGSGRTYR